MQGICLQPFFLQDVENSKPYRTGNRISAKGAEEFHAIVKGLRDLARTDYGGQRKRIADWFAEHHDVWHDALRFESPEMCAQPPEADLHFVGYADATGSADMTIDFGQIVRRKNDLSADAGQCFCNVRRPLPLRLQFAANLADMSGVFGTWIWFAAPVDAPIVVCKRRHVYPRFLAGSAGTSELVRAYINQSVGVPVVRMFEDNRVIAMRCSAREPQRQFIGFAAGIYDVTDPERVRQQLRQPFCVLQNIFVQVACVCVEQSQLFLR